MTARWGGIGWLWNKPVAFVFIRPERYTYEFVEKNDYLTLSFLGEENKKIQDVYKRQPHNFSFNSPQGACPKCQGLGVVNQIDVDKVIPERELSIY